LDLTFSTDFVSSCFLPVDDFLVRMVSTDWVYFGFSESLIMSLLVGNVDVLYLEMYWSSGCCGWICYGFAFACLILLACFAKGLPLWSMNLMLWYFSR
jgi:hypothetical protein